MAIFGRLDKGSPAVSAILRLAVALLSTVVRGILPLASRRSVPPPGILIESDDPTLSTGFTVRPVNPAWPKLPANLAGEYAFRQTLSRGAHTVVQRAVSRSGAGDAAIKLLYPSMPGASDATADWLRSRFRREAARVERLNHPNLIRSRCWGENEGQSYLVMPYIAGGTLKWRLRSAGPVDLASASHLIRLIAAGLAHVHQLGMVHLDVKPGNILLDAEGNPIIIDFGVARDLGEEPEPSVQEPAGTPAYMAPEHLAGQVVDGRADEYALALVAYELLTARQAVPVKTLDERHAAPDPRSHLTELAFPLRQVLQRALAPSPDGRFPSVEDFARAFQAVCR